MTSGPRAPTESDRDPRAGTGNEDSLPAPRSSFRRTRYDHAVAPSIEHRTGAGRCQKCGYAFARHRRGTSARKIHTTNVLARMLAQTGAPVCNNGRLSGRNCSIRCVGRGDPTAGDPTLIQQELTVGWKQRDRPIRPKSASRICKEELAMLAKAMERLLTPIRKRSCPSSSC